MNVINGLISLENPFESIIEDSRKKMAIIGAISSPPGFINQTAPKIPNKIGIKK